MSSQPFQFTRRNFFRGAAVLFAGAFLGACGTTPRGYEGQRRALPIPPLADAVREGDRVTFRLDAGAVDARILPDASAPAWGFNGAHLGPTLRARRGEDVTLEVHNGLDEMTTIHWHGMKLPARMDGGPHQPIEPGEAWAPHFRIDQPAATLWYHPHPHGLTGLHVYRGLAGLFYLDDDVSDGLALPKGYGVNDIPVILMDHNFHYDGTLDEIEDPDVGLKGEVLSVNGITNAEFTATTRRVRWRILDASTTFVSTTAGPSTWWPRIPGCWRNPWRWSTCTSVPVSGPRSSWIWHRGRRSCWRPRNSPTISRCRRTGMSWTSGWVTTSSCCRSSGRRTGPLSARHCLHSWPPAAGIDVDGAVEREFRLNTFEINGELMDMTRVDVTVDHDRPEVWTVVNENSDWIHNFHIHNAFFHVLSVAGTQAPVWTLGPKDTVALPPGATVRLAVGFGQHPDPEWAYMYHCHMLFHEDQGMMGQLVMVEPGQEADLGEGCGQAGH